MQHYDVIVIGGGAAGLFCAMTAGQRGRRVLVLEGSNRIGKKILMSGGGRCNFTNMNCEPANFISSNPHFCISALARYTPWDFVALVQKHGIAFHEKTAGQLFCDNSSKDIVSMLASECEAADVSIATHSVIESVAAGDGYVVTSQSGTYQSESLVVATGGLSIPKMGASDFGYRLARQFGLEILETRAGLVPFTFSGPMKEMGERLAGTSLPVRMMAGDTAFDEQMLFTHRGLSGPAALQVSSYWEQGTALSVDLLPRLNGVEILKDAKRSNPRSMLRSVLARLLPRALAGELEPRLWPELAATPMAEIRDSTLDELADALHCWILKPSGTEGYRTAEVTLGGVDTRGLSSQTMEVHGRPGLYFIGEVVDVTGHLGGFNFQWAWASAHAAGQVA